MGKLENKVALVTGASSGMGKAIATLFAKEGAQVIPVARRIERLEDLIKEIKAGGGEAIAVAGDVTSEDDIQNAIKTAIDNYGKLDIVVNNAGLLDKTDPIDMLDDETWNNVFNVNVTGHMRIMRAVVPIFKKQGGGAFVNVTSIAAITGAHSGPAYTASKHAALGLSKNTAFFFAKDNIRSNAICPGYVDTEMVAGLGDVNQEGLETVSLGAGANPRMGSPEEIAQLAVFLASDDASFVNGAVVSADAGWAAY
ncbi:MAG: glucose 1-dehydrogenase [Methanobacterium sp.]|nr:MAG: glucose 1-dehydrogenase [Methanobacterium sp.]